VDGGGVVDHRLLRPTATRCLCQQAHSQEVQRGNVRGERQHLVAREGETGRAGVEKGDVESPSLSHGTTQYPHKRSLRSMNPRAHTRHFALHTKEARTCPYGREGREVVVGHTGRQRVCSACSRLKGPTSPQLELTCASAHSASFRLPVRLWMAYTFKWARTKDGYSSRTYRKSASASSANSRPGHTHKHGGRHNRSTRRGAGVDSGGSLT
jgi:hypothetical protein